MYTSYIFCLSQPACLIVATIESFRREINRLAHKSFETVGNMLNFECQEHFAPFFVVFIRTFEVKVQTSPVNPEDSASLIRYPVHTACLQCSEVFTAQNGVWVCEPEEPLQWRYHSPNTTPVLRLNSEWSCSSCHPRKRSKFFPVIFLAPTANSVLVTKFHTSHAVFRTWNSQFLPM